MPLIFKIIVLNNIKPMCIGSTTHSYSYLFTPIAGKSSVPPIIVMHMMVSRRQITCPFIIFIYWIIYYNSWPFVGFSVKIAMINFVVSAFQSNGVIIHAAFFRTGIIYDGTIGNPAITGISSSFAIWPQFYGTLLIPQSTVAFK